MSDLVLFIVEDDPIFGALMEHNLRMNSEYTIFRCMTGKECIDNLHRKPFAMTLDYSLPDMTGKEILREVKAVLPDIEVVMVSGQEDVSTAVSLIREGAYDYFEKSDPDLRNRLWNTLIRITKSAELKGELKYLREALATRFEYARLILGKSASMARVFSLVERACKTNITVSITGETGTGKELVAKAIHYNSERRLKPFVSVNIAAIPADMIESELFGYERGAFIHAFSRKRGKLEEANGGSLFLDEVADMEPGLQAKLLRVIQERELIRIGGTEPVRVDVRILVATNRNLSYEMNRGTFREDLYFSLLGLPIHIPPLRDREGDLLLLAGHFAEEFCRENKMKNKSFSREAKEKLMAYPFPGNVRELKAVIELAVVMSTGDRIEVDDISLPVNRESSEFVMNDSFTLEDYTRKIITSYLDKYDNNIVLVAEKLDIGKSTLYRMRQKREV